MSRIAVLGAGPAGLACARGLLAAGHAVTIYEADDRPGGMSAHFDFDGLDIERFYHFICTPDHALITLLRELGIEDRLLWQRGTMGYFYRGEVHEWGHPLALLRFPHLSWLSKLRYAVHTWLSINVRNWPGLDDLDAMPWVQRWVGRQAFEVLWRPLFDLKFFEYAQPLSAAWIRSRIQRLGKSRKSIFEEQLGVLRGGSRVLLDRLVEDIEARGGTLRLSCPAREIAIEDGRVRGVRTDAGFEEFDAVASTMPIPHLVEIVPSMPEALRERYAKLDNIGAICVLFKLRRPLSKYFWLNTTDPDIPVPGVIEYSNLQPLSESVVYVPYYLPGRHPRFEQSDASLVETSYEVLARINPELHPDDVLATRVSRLRYAQPICPPGFPDRLPPIATAVEGLFVADTSWYYPEDRSISESVALGARIAGTVEAETGTPHRTD
ncbi:MAG: NAD(P)/FAD-dependent oxidoreductase [Myxococcota bacterium]|jgi:protoporphyrinogen oxidase|nr:NAD(P)/FAD-dependent oxidoreductase [Myxococcota bacterium]